MEKKTNLTLCVTFFFFIFIIYWFYWFRVLQKKKKAKTPIADRLWWRRRNTQNKKPRRYKVLRVHSEQYIVGLCARCTLFLQSVGFLHGSRFPGLIFFFRTVDPGNPETPPRKLQRRARAIIRVRRALPRVPVCDASTTATRRRAKTKQNKNLSSIECIIQRTIKEFGRFSRIFRSFFAGFYYQPNEICPGPRRRSDRSFTKTSLKTTKNIIGEVIVFGRKAISRTFH